MKLLTVLFPLIFLFYFLTFKDRVWFFHDNFDSLVESLNFSVSSLFSPYNEHFTPIPKLLFHFVFLLFGLNFTPYFILSICLHLLNLFVLWLIVRELTRKNFFAYLAVLLFAVNVTFFEIILWINFSAIMVCLFVGLAFLFWLKFRQKKNKSYLFLSIASAWAAAFSFTIGLICPLVLAILCFLDKKSGKKAGIPFVFLTLIVFMLFFYFSKENINTGHSQIFNLPSIFQIISFIYTGLTQALLLRFFFALYPTRFLALNHFLLPFLLIITLFFLVLISFFSGKTKEVSFLKIALLVNIIYPYAFISLVRSNLGAQGALAERYAYFSLFFLVIFLVYEMSFLKQQLWLRMAYIIFIFYTLTTQGLVFYKRSFIFTKLMITNKIFFLKLSEEVKNNKVEADCKIPKFPNGRQDSCSRYIKLLKESK